MSRYSISRESGATVVYGLDHVYGYFLDVYPVGAGDEADIFSVATSFEDGHICRISKGEMLEKWQEFGVPAKHCSLLALDLPLPEQPDDAIIF